MIPMPPVPGPPPPAPVDELVAPPAADPLSSVEPDPPHANPQQRASANHALVSSGILQNLLDVISHFLSSIEYSHRGNAADARGARNCVATIRVDGAELAVLRTD